jgi:hypothetical protein
MNLRVILFGGVAVSLCACGKVDFGTGCEKAVDLQAPWTEMGLPLEDGQARVCEASADELKVRSYTWTTKEEALPALKQALVAAGWAEDRCNQQACYFDKDGFEVSVQPMDFQVKKKKLVTIAMRHKADPRQARAAGKAEPEDGDGDDDKTVAAAGGGDLGVAECDAYVAQVESCKSFDKSAKAYTMLLDAWKKKIAAGEEDAVATACEKASSLFKCRDS